jgi:hypothetical protein
MTVYRKRNGYKEEYEVEPYQLNEGQIYLEDSGVIFNFSITDQTMTLRIKGNNTSLGARMVLRRLEGS